MTEFLYDVNMVDPNYAGNFMDNLLCSSFKDDSGK